MGAVDLSIVRMLTIYALLIVPAAAILWLRLPQLGRLAIAVARMTVQLSFVGLYLQFVFNTNNPWLTAAWMLAMIAVADFAILRSSGLRLRMFLAPVFASLILGTAIPMLVFVGLLLARPNVMDAQYAIPIAGMILGNCLQANIIGLRRYFRRLYDERRPFELSLVQGATLQEATRPHLRAAFSDAIAPTLASIATIGLVSLPGMMTGAILGGSDPITAIKYQMAIMIAILCGTSITVIAAILLARRRAFGLYGTLNPDVSSEKAG